MNHIDSKVIFGYYKAKFKLLPIDGKHKPKLSWVHEQPKNLYEHPDYWTEKKLKECLPMFGNVACVPGKAGLDQENRELYGWIIDVDSQAVIDRFATPICQLDEQIQILIKSMLHTEFRDSSPDYDTKTTLLDILKQNTIVVKTRKPFGFQIHALSHKQHRHVKNDKHNCEYEIKTDNSLGHAMLPPSTHRNDSNFKYSHFGRSDKIVVSDLLYDIITRLLFDLTSEKEKKKDNQNNTKQEKQKQQKQAQQHYTYHNISNQMIETTVSLLTPYYKERSRNNFALAFSGLAWNSKISQECVLTILRNLAVNNKDIENRSSAVTETYRKAENNEKVVGGPTLAQIIAKIKKDSNQDDDKDLDEADEELGAANTIVLQLQTFWDNDIQQEIRREQNKARNDPDKIFSISEAIRLVEHKQIQVIGKLVGASKIQPMLSHALYACDGCSYRETLAQYLDGSNRPVWKSPIKDKSKCHQCKRGDIRVTNKKHITTLEVQILSQIRNAEFGNEFRPKPPSKAHHSKAFFGQEPEKQQE